MPKIYFEPFELSGNDWSDAELIFPGTIYDGDFIFEVSLWISTLPTEQKNFLAHTISKTHFNI